MKRSIQIPNFPEGRLVNFYSIAGIYEDQTWSSAPGPANIAFWGVFLIESDTGRLQGKMMDNFGEADIEGSMLDGHLKFSKRYGDHSLGGWSWELLCHGNSFEGRYEGVKPNPSRSGKIVGKMTLIAMGPPNLVVDHEVFNSQG